MKIIFLDIDGVLVTERCKNVDYRLGIARKEFDTQAVENLKEIIKKTNAYIVISSTWRYGTQWTQFNELFTQLGINNRVIGQTPRVKNRLQRGDEIQAYLEDHVMEIENFVILDDNDDMGLYLRNLIRTKNENGIDEEIKQKTIKKLGA